MNKNIKLTYEEKRVPAEPQAAPPKNANRDYKQEWADQSTPIPITIQCRSKSEPRTQTNETTHCNSPTMESSSPAHHTITFHRHDDNPEIIAVVNVPETAGCTTETVESVHARAVRPVNHFFQQSSAFSKSVPNLLEDEVIYF